MRFVKSKISSIVDIVFPLIIVILILDVISISNDNIQKQIDLEGTENVDFIEYIFDKTVVDNLDDVIYINYMNKVHNKRTTVYNEELEHVLPTYGDIINIPEKYTNYIMSNDRGIYTNIDDFCECENKSCNIYFRWIDTKFGKLLILYGICSDYMVGQHNVTLRLTIAIVLILTFALKIAFFNRWIHMNMLQKAYMDRMHVINIELAKDGDNINISKGK